MTLAQPQSIGQKQENKFTWLVLLLVFVLAAAFFSFAPILPRLVFSFGNRALLVLPLQKPETFCIQFTHSANLSPVTDEYEWTGDTLILRQSRFLTFGAGIPSPADGIGKELVHTDEGEYVLTGIDAPRSFVDIMIGDIPDQRLLYRGQEIHLSTMIAPGNVLRMQVRHVPLLYELLFAGNE